MAFDPERKKVIVGLRGTSSLADLMTDVAIKSVPLEIEIEIDEKNMKNGFCHKGMQVRKCVSIHFQLSICRDIRDMAIWLYLYIVS